MNAGPGSSPPTASSRRRPELAQAAATMARHPAPSNCACCRRWSTSSAEKNSTLVMPFPVEMLRFFDKASTPADQSAPAVAPASALPIAPTAPPIAPQPSRDTNGAPTPDGVLASHP